MVSGEYYRRFDDTVPQYLPQSSQSTQYSDGFKELSNDEIRHIYHNTSLTKEVHFFYFRNGQAIKESPALRKVVVGRVQHPDSLVDKAVQFSEAGLEVLRYVRGVASDADGPESRGEPMLLLAVFIIRCSDFRRRAAAPSYCTVMQPVRTLSMVPQ